MDLAEYQGEIEDICTRKCEDAFNLLNTPVIVEDTSLCFNALNGLPGTHHTKGFMFTKTKTICLVLFRNYAYILEHTSK